MQQGMFRVPGTVHFGSGQVETVAEHVRALGGQRVFLVTDPGLVRAGIAGRVAALLEGAGLPVKVWDGVSPNPRDHECDAAAVAAREFGADIVVAVGGGSPIDLAKAVAGLATNTGAATEWEAPRTFEQPPLPLVAIPTTAGTGSEVTRSSVINDTTRQVKITLRDIRMAPRIALVDPDLTVGVPRDVTAATGMDALTHAVEAYTCRRATPVTDALALHAIRLISAALPKVVADGTDREARETMMMGSLVAGMAFGNSDVASVHCIAEAIGGRYDVPHGVANSMFLPVVFDWNAQADPKRHADVARAMGLPDTGATDEAMAVAGALHLRAMADEIGIPRFRDVPGIEPEAFPWIAAASQANLSTGSNAREMDEAAYLALLEQAWAYGA